MSRKPDLGLPEPVVGWIYNHARKNLWRLAAWYDIDDLTHDGLMIAYKCRERYGVPGVDIDHPHYMRLVQTSFRNHIGDLLRHMRAADDRTKFADLAEDEAAAMDKVLPSQEPEVDYAALICELPLELRKVVDLYVNAPKQLRQMRTRLDGTVEHARHKLARLTGFPVSKDFEMELRVHLWEREQFLTDASKEKEGFEWLLSLLSRTENFKSTSDQRDGNRLYYRLPTGKWTWIENEPLPCEP